MGIKLASQRLVFGSTCLPPNKQILQFQDWQKRKKARLLQPRLYALNVKSCFGLQMRKMAHMSLKKRCI